MDGKSFVDRQYIICRHDYEGYDVATKAWGSWRDATVFPSVFEAIKAAPRESGIRVQDRNHNYRLTWHRRPDGFWVSNDGNFVDRDAPNLIDEAKLTDLRRHE